jgi:hypothetical protein
VTHDNGATGAEKRAKDATALDGELNKEEGRVGVGIPAHAQRAGKDTSDGEAADRKLRVCMPGENVLADAGRDEWSGGAGRRGVD